MSDTPNSKHILFVDDEPMLIRMFEEFCHQLGVGWTLSAASSGTAALEVLAQRPIDVIVTDYRMPGMSGAELLDKVMHQYPGTARILMSGYVDPDQTMDVMGVSHQFLRKPFLFQELSATISRLIALQNLAKNGRLQRLVSGISTLPTLPKHYFALTRELASPTSDSDSVAAIINQDPSLTAKLLKTVNSAYLGLKHPITSVNEALNVLGFATVQALALSKYAFSTFDSHAMPDFPLESLWGHSLATGMLAKKIAEEFDRDGKLARASFSAGVLHDLGKLLLRVTLPDEFAAAIAHAHTHHVALEDGEREVIGTTHAEIGAYLLGLWGLPVSIVEGVAWHHAPAQLNSRDFTAATAVHVADFIVSKKMPSYPPLPSSPLDNKLLETLGVGDRIRKWERVDAR